MSITITSSVYTILTRHLLCVVYFCAPTKVQNVRHHLSFNVVGRVYLSLLHPRVVVSDHVLVLHQRCVRKHLVHGHLLVVAVHPAQAEFIYCSPCGGVFFSVHPEELVFIYYIIY